MRMVRRAQSTPSMRVNTIAIAEPAMATSLVCFANTQPKHIVNWKRKQRLTGFVQTREPAFYHLMDPRHNGSVIVLQISMDLYVFHFD